MGDLKTKYQIEITQTGGGGAAAAAEFQKVDAAAKAANASMAAAAAGTKSLQNTTTGAAAGLRALNGTLVLVGMQAFPQVTMAAMTAQSAFTGVRAAAVAMNVSLAAAAGPIAVIIAGLIAAAKAGKEMFSMMGATQEWSESMKTMQERARIDAAKLREIIITEVEKGRLQLSDAEAVLFDKMLDEPTIERLGVIRRRLMEALPASFFRKDSENSGIAREQIADLERMLELEKARQALMNKPATLSGELEILNRRLALYRELHAEGVLTEKELAALSEEAEIKWNNVSAAIANVKKPLTDLQQLGQQVTQQFAAGLSSAIVQSFKEGGEALKNFAAQFFATVAQMILQMLILRALKSAFPGLAAADGGMFPSAAASGGFFPRMMASGGMAGVSSVSQPTYFPKFNVVAGEAGREMLTVLARPRFMSVGGMQAVVGNAGPNRLAITNADDLARGGAGGAGHIVVDVNLSPDLEGRIVKNSVEHSVVRVTQDMSRDSKLSRTTKQLR